MVFPLATASPLFELLRLTFSLAENVILNRMRVHPNIHAVRSLSLLFSTVGLSSAFLFFEKRLASIQTLSIFVRSLTLVSPYSSRRSDSRGPTFTPAGDVVVRHLSKGSETRLSGGAVRTI